MFGDPKFLNFRTGEVSCVYPVAEVNLSLLDELINRQLLPLWVSHEGSIQKCLSSSHGMAILGAIAEIVPSHTSLSFSPLRFLDPQNLEIARDFLFYQEAGIRPGILIEMNMFVPMPRPDKRRKSNDDPITIYDIPFPSSGNPGCDRLANLISGFGEFGVWMYRNFPAEWNDKILYSWAELQKPPSDRVSEFLHERFQSWSEQNREEFEQAMFRPSILRSTKTKTPDQTTQNHTEEI